MTDLQTTGSEPDDTSAEAWTCAAGLAFPVVNQACAVCGSRPRQRCGMISHADEPSVLIDVREL